MTYTDEQVQAKVDEATAPLRAQLDELLAAKSDEQVAVKIAEAVTPLSDKIAELEAAADTMTAQLNTVTAERDALVQANTEREEADEKERVRSERIEGRKEKAKDFFTDEQIAERAERWADMDDAAFDQLIEDVKEVATANGAEPIVRPSALTASEQRITKPAGGAMSETARKVLSQRRGRLASTNG